MRLRRYTRSIRIVLVWAVVFMLAVDTASACWWLRCRRSYRCCPPVYCTPSAQAESSPAEDPAFTGPPSPQPEDGWRPQPSEGAVTGYDVEENENPIAPEEFVPATPAPGAVTGVDPLDELPPAEDLPLHDELPVPSEEEQAEIVEEAEEEELAEESTGDLDEETLTEEATEDAGDLFGPPAPEEATEGPGDLFGAEPSDDTFEPVEEPAVEDEGEDLLAPGPLAEGDDFSLPAEDPADEPADQPAEDDLFGPGGDLFGEPAAEPADSGDDLFGPAEEPADSGDDLFGPGPADEPAESGDDLFGPPAADSGDDLFGPAADDPLEAPAEPADDDLFGPAPAEEESSEDNYDDLFGGQPTLDDALAMRTWVDNTGLYSTQGRLLVIGDDYVQLMKDNGHTTTVPIRRLSENDRLLVERVIAAYGMGEIDRLASR